MMGLWVKSHYSSNNMTDGLIKLNVSLSLIVEDSKITEYKKVFSPTTITP
jgi:hypothetical protein